MVIVPTPLPISSILSLGEIFNLLIIFNKENYRLTSRIPDYGANIEVSSRF